MCEDSDCWELEEGFHEELQLSLSVTLQEHISTLPPPLPSFTSSSSSFRKYNKKSSRKSMRNEECPLSTIQETGENDDETNKEILKEDGRRLAIVVWLMAWTGKSPSQVKLLVDMLNVAGISSLSMLANKDKEDPGLLELVGLDDDSLSAINRAMKKFRKRRHKSLKRERLLSEISACLMESIDEYDTCLKTIIDDFDGNVVEMLPRSMNCFQKIVSSVEKYMTMTKGGGEAMQVELGRRGAIVNVVKLIDIFLDSSERFVQSSFRAVCMLCCRKLFDGTSYIYENIDRFGNLDIAKLSVAAMLKYQESLLVMKWTTQAVSILCSNHNLQSKLGTCGVCPALLQAGKKYASSNETVVLWVIDALSKVCSNNVENRNSVLHHGVCEFLANVMVRFVLVESVIVRACSFLRSLIGNRKENDYLRNKIVDLRYCEILSDCLVLYQKKSCQYLTSKMGDSSTEKEELDDFLDASPHIGSVDGSDVFVEVCRAVIILVASSNEAAARFSQDKAIYQAMLSPFKVSGEGMSHGQIIHIDLAALWCLKSMEVLCCNILICQELISSGVYLVLESVLKGDRGYHIPLFVSALRVCIKLFSIPVQTILFFEKLQDCKLIETLVSLLSAKLIESSENTALLVVQAICAVASIQPIDDCTTSSVQKRSSNFVDEVIQTMVGAGVYSGLVRLLSWHCGHKEIVFCGLTAMTAVMLQGHNMANICQEDQHRISNVRGREVLLDSSRFVVSHASLVTNTSTRSGDDTVSSISLQSLCQAMSCSILCIGSMCFNNIPNTQHFKMLGMAHLVLQIFSFAETILSSNDNKDQIKILEFRRLLTQLCDLFRVVCVNDTDLGLELGSLGACRCVLSIIEYHYSDEDLSQQACNTLVCLTTPKINDSKKKLQPLELRAGLTVRSTKRSLLENISFVIGGDLIGMFDILVRMLGFHSVTTEEIASLGCQLLGNVFKYLIKQQRSPDEDLSIGTSLTKTLYNVIIMALGSHLKSELVQKHCILAANGLFEYNQYCRHDAIVLGQICYPGILLNALVEHKSCPDIVAASMQALIELIKDVDSNRDVIRKRDGCGAVVDALQYFANSIRVVEAGCQLIYDIASEEVTRELLFESKAPYTLLSVLKLYSSLDTTPYCHDIDMVKNALKATLALAKLDKNLAALTYLEQQTANTVSLSVCDIMANALMKFRNDAEVVVLSLELVLVLGMFSDEKSRRRRSNKMQKSDMVAEKIVSQYNTSLLPSSSLPLEIEHIYDNASFPNRSHIVRVQTHVLVQDMLEFHVDNVGILSVGCECIAMIASDDVGAKAVGEDEEVCVLVCNILKEKMCKELHLETIVCKAIGNLARFTVNTLLLSECGVCGLLVSCLEHYYTESSSMVKEACLSLAYLCRFNTTNKISLASRGACKILHECFVLYISDDDVIPSVMFAMVAMCHQNKINLAKFSGLGVTDFLLELYIGSDLVATQKNDSMIAMILWFIGNAPPTSMEMLSSSEVCKFALTNIYMSSKAVVVAFGCDAIASLNASPHNRKYFVANRAIEILQELFTSFSDNGSVLSSSLLAIAALAVPGTDFQSSVSVSAVFSVMEDHFGKMSIVEASLKVLLGIMRDKTTSRCLDSTRKAFESPVNSKILLDSCRHFLTVESVALLSCQLLAAMDANILKSIQRDLVEFGACDLLVDSIKIYKRSPKLLIASCEAASRFFYLSFSTVSALCKRGFLSALSVMLGGWLTHEDLVYSASEVIAAVSVPRSAIWGNNASLANELMVAEIPRSVVEIIQIYAAVSCHQASFHALNKDSEGIDVDILNLSVDSVTNMATMSSKLSSELEQAGICECLVLILMKYAKYHSVLRATLASVLVLAKSGTCRKQLLELKIVDHMDSILQTSRDEDNSNNLGDDEIRLFKKVKGVLLGQSVVQRGIDMLAG